MPITQDNALSILPLLEDWNRAQTSGPQQDRNLNQDPSGFKVFRLWTQRYQVGSVFKIQTTLLILILLCLFSPLYCLWYRSRT